MRKTRKNRRQRRSPSHPTPLVPSGKTPPRNAGLDTLRGIAIVLMVIDHAADMLFGLSIAADNIRLLTRLSMPLFCVLMGYFQQGQSEMRWNRLWQIVVAAVAANLICLSLFGRLEILASLLVCALAVGLLRDHFLWLVALACLVELDPSAAMFDYPLMLCAAMVSLGMILRKFGPRIGLAASLLLPIAGLGVTTNSVYVMWFAPLATGLVCLAAAKRIPDIPGLRDLGRYPLTAYVAQYYVLFFIRQSVA